MSKPNDNARTGPELFAEAIRLRREARDEYDFPSEGYALAIAEADLCATLALAAATALGLNPPVPHEHSAWQKVCGVKRT